MNGEARRRGILTHIRNCDTPVSGSRLSEMFHVSRQVIVQDIALLRAASYDIVSTHRGYVLKEPLRYERVVQVCHTDEEIVDELQAIVDLGAWVTEVFVKHGIYGELRAAMDIRSRRDVETFMAGIRSGASSPLKNITSGYHYHRIAADSEEILDLAEKALKEKGYLL